ncbi:cyclophilin-like protein [Rozella allomycis CSF55]|uniref:peptidylprolyl isomerase n=1 Tax=Rozella allomycis (strain CSF55) TaxID=988480 RepID=A0A075ARK3_ROZAC|nr:Cyclophilin-like peptidyl-prolyl cis-trans isomerase domain-containing protein [Rozella allomycis CSF55]RKP20449.1 cyclophilin-like protein [Rozella allomycis CSF55]|eukprot:EPZ31132.1 Cyclophilin-like peptidyl-prolyl cis-trans isomerase domain-containing protein [Rozella allomycis CSF55]
MKIENAIPIDVNDIKFDSKTPKTLIIVGSLNSIPFQKSKILIDTFPECFNLKIEEMTPFEWQIYKSSSIPKLNVHSEAIVFYDNEYLAVAEFVEIVDKQYGITDSRPETLYKAMSNAAMTNYYNLKENTIVSLEMKSGEENIGKLTLELFDKICPKTIQNFKNFIKGCSIPSIAPEILKYSGTLIHRVSKNAFIQGGGMSTYYTGKDIISSGGNNNLSSFGNLFEGNDVISIDKDENFIGKHNQRGIISMANCGPHSNGSQFIIDLKSQPSFDKRYVVFGRIIDGCETLEKVENVKVDDYERPIINLAIGNTEIVYECNK